MSEAHRLEGLTSGIDGLSVPQLNELRRRIDRRLVDLQRAGGRSLVERLSAAKTVELAALRVMSKGIRARTLDTGESVTLRPYPGVRHEAEAQVLSVEARRAWTYGRTVYLSGTILDRRIDAAALGLTPLKLDRVGTWDPESHYWGDPGKPVAECFRPVIAAGPRPSFRMESVLPGFDPNDPDSDPIARAIELAESGGWGEACDALGECLERDLRALDAHAHLGAWRFGEDGDEWRAKEALPHYEAGVAIGELSLGPGFQGVLSWLTVENRPFLRCVHGLGLCRWALGDLGRTREVFSRMLWLNPHDNQGARFLLEEVSAGVAYADSKH